MANQDDSFIREVNEELRSDQMRAIWRRFGRVLIGAAVLLVLGTIGKVTYEYWRETEASAAGDRFLSALTEIREGNREEGQQQLAALEKDGFGAYPVLARMRTASLLAENGDTTGAVAAFQSLARDGTLPQALRDVARLRAAYLLVDGGSYDEISAEAEQLTNPASPMRHSAREVLGLSAYKHGDFDRAKEWFEQITGDGESPRNVASRAQMMLDLIAAGGKAS